MKRANLTWALMCAFVIAFFWAAHSAEGGERRPVPLVICDVFGTKCAPAMRVAYCESRLRPDAVSRTRDVGVFQVNYAAHRKRGESFTAFKRRMSDVRRNVEFAYRLSRGGTDWDAWVCRWAA